MNWWDTNLGAGALGALFGSVVSFVTLIGWDNYKGGKADERAISTIRHSMHQNVMTLKASKRKLQDSLNNYQRVTNGVSFDWHPIIPLSLAFWDVLEVHGPALHVRISEEAFIAGTRDLAQAAREFNKLAHHRDEWVIGNITTPRQMGDPTQTKGIGEVFDSGLLEKVDAMIEQFEELESIIKPWHKRLRFLLGMKD